PAPARTLLVAPGPAAAHRNIAPSSAWTLFLHPNGWAIRTASPASRDIELPAPCLTPKGTHEGCPYRSRRAPTRGAPTGAAWRRSNASGCVGAASRPSLLRARGAGNDRRANWVELSWQIRTPGAVTGNSPAGIWQAEAWQA